MAFEPEVKLRLLRLLLEHGAEVRTYYRRRRIVAAEKFGSYVLIRYEDGEADKLHMSNFARRRFVAML
jgi:hypothetical protein